MSDIKLHHVNNETTELIKLYLNEYDKIVKLMQQTTLQKKTNLSRCENNH